MSALTKVFVVLLVIMSVMITAGMVTFVNKLEDFKQSTLTAKAETARERTAKESALADANAARAERDSAVAAANNASNAHQAAYNAKLEQVAQLQSQVEASKLDVQRAQILATTAQNQAKEAQTTQGTTETALQELRKSDDDLQKKYSEAMVSISQLTNQLDATSNRYKKSLEDLATAQQTIDNLKKPGAQLGFDTQNAGPARGAIAGNNMNLRGVVRSTRNIQGKEYATISIGSADNVQKGMKFRVVDRASNRFLGYLTVDQVDYNEATGHLDGDAVAQVKAGNDVFTAWQ